MPFPALVSQARRWMVSTTHPRRAVVATVATVVLAGLATTAVGARIPTAGPFRSVQQSSNWGGFAVLKADGSVVTWGDATMGGDSSAVAAQLASGVTELFSNYDAFAALKADGSVVTWGSSGNGGDSSAVAGALSSGVVTISSNDAAFAALKSDGSVVTWGVAANGGDSSSVAGSLASGVVKVLSTGSGAFAALKSDGSVITWGSGGGGNSSSVAGQLTSGVVEVVSSYDAFAARKSDGSVVAWGNAGGGGDPNCVAVPGCTAAPSGALASGVTKVIAGYAMFAALKSDGSLVTWGTTSYGGDSSSVAGSLTSGVTDLVSAYYAVAARKSDGSVVAWGDASYGGDASAVAGQLTSGVTKVVASGYAFAVLKTDGSVVTWGDPNYGGNSACAPTLSCKPAPSGSLASGVTRVLGAGQAFAALKSDGSVIAWGDPNVGGDSTGVAAALGSGVTDLTANYYAFAANKADGSVVAWGYTANGGDASSAAPALAAGVLWVQEPFSTPPPAVTAISPTSGPAAGGTAVTITGLRFRFGASATVGGAPCTNVVVVSQGTLTCTTSAHAAGVVDVAVENVGSDPVVLPSAFTYVAAPVPPAPPAPAPVAPTSLPTRIACVQGACVTTVTAPAGTTSVTQAARRARGGARTGRCRSVTGGASPRYRCTVALTPGRWRITTTARGGSTVLAHSVRSVRIRRVFPVTG